MTQDTDPSSIPACARAVLTIDLDALRANYRLLAQMSEPAQCAGVIKADAYGLGVGPIAKALWAEGCKTFFIASLDEGQELRAIMPDALIYAFDGELPGTSAGFIEADILPVLGSLDEIAEWAAFCQQSGKRHRAAIHIDTGMNRLGLSPRDVPILAQRKDQLAAFELTTIMTHLVSGDYRGDPLTMAQADLFDELRAQLPPAPASLANSAGVQLGGRLVYDLTRPGIAIYGGHVFTDAPNPMQPVVYLRARILQVRDIEPSETIGYNETWRADKPMRVATLATGYADGFLRRQSATNADPGLPVYIAGHGEHIASFGHADYDCSLPQGGNYA